MDDVLRLYLHFLYSSLFIMSDEYKYPALTFTKYHLRVLNALESDIKHRKILHNISGYVADLYSFENNVLLRLLETDLVQKHGDEKYKITERGSKSLHRILEYRDVDVLDARDENTESKSNAYDRLVAE